MKNSVSITKFATDNNLKLVAGGNGLNREIFEEPMDMLNGILSMYKYMEECRNKTKLMDFEDPDVMKLCGCSRNSYYKYKKEIKNS